MSFDFDAVIDRTGTHATRYDARMRVFGRDDIDPLWIADMDFAAPPCVTQALLARARHPVYGYTQAPESLVDAILQWYRQRHGWAIEREWIVLAPSVLPSLAAALQATTAPGDGVIIQPPVYTEFAAIIRANGRRVVDNPLREAGGHYTMDLEHLEQCARQGARLLMLCNPHNPVGRAWQADELHEVLCIARRHGLAVVCDEIHGDLAHPGTQHTMLGQLAQPDDMLLTAVAPGKTFNLQGMGLSALVIPRQALRQQVARAFAAMHLDGCHPFSAAAAEAAYRKGGPWLDALLAYLRQTHDFVADELRTHVSGIRLVPAQAGYLLWLDCRGLGLDDDALRRFFIDRCRLGLNPGHHYGAGGSGFMRMNIGVPRQRIVAALEAIRNTMTG